MWHILSFVLGAVVGSFLNVVIYRLPREDLKLWNPPRSFCPNCGHPLSWKDNIPIVSYILLKGRCRYCGWKIPIRYPLVEILNASFYTFASFAVTDSFVRISLFGLFSTLLVIAFVDFETMTISDSLNLSVLVFSILIALGTGGLVRGLMVGGSVFAIFFLVSKISGGFGMGDVLLLGASSVAMEPISVNFAILVSAIVALLYSVIKNRGLKTKERVPFGPFLAIGITFGVLHTLWMRGVLIW